jgi:hypothetical protein
MPPMPASPKTSPPWGTWPIATVREGKGNGFWAQSSILPDSGQAHGNTLASVAFQLALAPPPCTRVGHAGADCVSGQT